MAHQEHYPESTRTCRSGHELDVERLHAYLAQSEVRARVGDGLTVRQFRGGQSNPTYWLRSETSSAATSTASEWVLRKKPPGKLLPSAHAVEREFRVMKALSATEVPVARMELLCTDESVIGTPFFLMEYKPGRLFWNVQLPELEPSERAAIYEELARVLAALHEVDVDQLGLRDYGKTGGYVARQVSRWSKQYEASKTDSIDSMDKLARFLPDHVPSEDETTLTHGDYRLDNLIFASDAPRCEAVIDWELSTLGHPLCDLAYTCMLYHVALPNVGGLLGVDFDETGIPTENAFIEMYLRHRGRGELADWPYYKAFSLYRLAAIAQGVYKRSLQGNASNDSASMFGAAVPMLSAIACQLVGI